jgi:hypothetical protein
MPTTNFTVDVFQDDGDIKHARVTDTQDPPRFQPLTITVRQSDDIHVKGQTLITNAFQNLIDDAGTFYGEIAVTWEWETVIDPETGKEYTYPKEQDTVKVAN